MPIPTLPWIKIQKISEASNGFFWVGVYEYPGQGEKESDDDQVKFQITDFWIRGNSVGFCGPAKKIQSQNGVSQSHAGKKIPVSGCSQSGVDQKIEKKLCHRHGQQELKYPIFYA